MSNRPEEGRIVQRKFICPHGRPGRTCREIINIPGAFQGFSQISGTEENITISRETMEHLRPLQVLKSQEQAKLFDDSKMGGRGPEMFSLMIGKGPPAPMLNGNPDQHFLISVQVTLI